MLIDSLFAMERACITRRGQLAMRMRHFVMGLLIATLLVNSSHAFERPCPAKVYRVNFAIAYLRVRHDGTVEWNGTPITDKQFRDYAARAASEENTEHPVRFHIEKHPGDGDSAPLRREGESLGLKFLDCAVVEVY